MSDELMHRIEMLESKLAFQDDTIDQLNQTVTELNQEIQSLKNELIAVAEKVVDAGQGGSDHNQVEIPPHY